MPQVKLVRLTQRSITMDKRINKSLCHSSFSIIRLVYTILCLFDKTDFGIIANKFTAAVQ